MTFFSGDSKISNKAILNCGFDFYSILSKQNRSILYDHTSPARLSNRI